MRRRSGEVSGGVRPRHGRLPNWVMLGHSHPTQGVQHVISHEDVRRPPYTSTAAGRERLREAETRLKKAEAEYTEAIAKSKHAQQRVLAADSKSAAQGAIVGRLKKEKEVAQVCVMCARRPEWRRCC